MEKRMLKSFPKIFAVGDRHIQKLFDGTVEITEKVDGSQFVFGKIDGELMCRSKGANIVMDAPEKMFSEAVEYVKSIEEKISDGHVYYAEYLKKPRHNTLAYDRIPQNYLVLFGWSIKDSFLGGQKLRGLLSKTMHMNFLLLIDFIL